ncbi:MAG: glutamine--tRNA ligase/YqeY domain fusion protein [Bacteroidota bacterium]
MSTHSPSVPADGTRPEGKNFLEEIVEDDLAAGRHKTVVTRFPPEPNGYPHIGHAKSIVLNFGLAQQHGGRTNLRFDDTNPETEDIEYVEAIKRDVRWLGFAWDEERYASDYFEQLYDWAVQLITDGKAYVDDLNEEEIRDYRGTVTEPGRESPYRARSVEENLDLFARMRAGEFPDGARVLRAKIDMAHPNMKMRDPLMYRIRHATHYRRGDAWCIYPMYDWAHGQSDAIEDITHSICTLEFENNRALYDWFLENLGIEDTRGARPHQYEFARLNLDYTVVSKRKLIQLVDGGHVAGWDDPRMPTIAGLRRRGVTPAAIRDFAERIGVAKANSRVDYSVLEYSIRNDLNTEAPRVLAVLDPLKVTITNYPEDGAETLDAAYWPHDIPKEGTRPLPFERTVYIERDDFAEDPPKKYRRLAPGRSVRLRHAYIITCDEVVKAADGTIAELRCRYHPDTLGSDAPEGLKVWGVIHWVPATRALPAEVRLYDRLFRTPDPEAELADGETFLDRLNPDSLTVHAHALVEPSLAKAAAYDRFQFERQGYFVVDPDTRPDRLVINRIVTLRDTWTKQITAPPVQKAPPPPPADPAPRPAPPSDPMEDYTEEQRALVARYVDQLGLDQGDAVILAGDLPLAQFFEEALNASTDPQATANWVIHELMRELKDTPLETLPFDGPKLGALVQLVTDETISTPIAKRVFAEMMKYGEPPADIVEKQGLRPITEADQIEPLVQGLMQNFPDKVGAYRAGKTGLLGFFVGQVMRATQGQADPQLVQRIVREKLAL